MFLYTYQISFLYLFYTIFLLVQSICLQYNLHIQQLRLHKIHQKQQNKGGRKMKKKVYALLLATTLVFSQTIPVCAEDLDVIAGEIIAEGENDTTEDAVSGGIIAGNDAVQDDSSDIIIEDLEEISVNEIEEDSTEDSFSGDFELAANEESDLDITEFVMTEESVSAEQLYASGNSISDAIGISLNTSYSGSISATNTADYYRFSLPSSGRITLTASAYMRYITYYYL
jgi:hypothetical protein